MSREVLMEYAERAGGNRIPGLLREVSEAILDEEDPERLRRLASSLREMGSIAANMAREKKNDDPCTLPNCRCFNTYQCEKGGSGSFGRK